MENATEAVASSHVQIDDPSGFGDRFGFGRSGAACSRARRGRWTRCAPQTRAGRIAGGSGFQTSTRSSSSRLQVPIQRSITAFMRGNRTGHRTAIAELGVTSLQTDAETPARHTRGHWGVEVLH